MQKSSTRWVMLIACLFLVVSGCGVSGSGTASTDSRSVASFDAVEVHGVIGLQATAGTPHSVELRGDDNIVPLIETQVVGNKLIIRSTESISPQLPLVAVVEATDIQRVILHGASKATVAGIDNDAFALEVHGASDSTLTGKTKAFEASLHGAGNIDAKAMMSDEATVSIHGAGNIEVADPKELGVSISGAGAVTYGGTPKVTQSVSGAGTVKKR